MIRHDSSRSPDEETRADNQTTNTADAPSGLLVWWWVSYLGLMRPGYSCRQERKSGVCVSAATDSQALGVGHGQAALERREGRRGQDLLEELKHRADSVSVWSKEKDPGVASKDRHEDSRSLCQP